MSPAEAYSEIERLLSVAARGIGLDGFDGGVVVFKATGQDMVQRTVTRILDGGDNGEAGRDILKKLRDGDL